MWWSKRQKALLRRLWESNQPVEDIARIVVMPEGDVQRQVACMGLSRKEPVVRVRRNRIPRPAGVTDGGRPLNNMGDPHATCQWPIGTPGKPGFHFCGAPVVSGKSYCPQHCKEAYDPEEQREIVHDL